MWALCHREHGLTWAEFENLTLGQLEALEERRALEIKHARFNAALVTSVIFNANRAPDTRPVSPFDFIAGCEEDPEQRERDEMRRSIKHGVALAFMNMKRPDGTPLDRAEVLEEKLKMCERMKENGVKDPEELIREVYPDL